MSIITDIRLIDREAWAQLVAVSPTATWFQTPEAYDFYASVPELLTPFVVAVTRETRASLAGVCVGYVSKASNPVAQYFTRRAIIFGGPLLAEDVKDDELSPLLLTVSCANRLMGAAISSKEKMNFFMISWFLIVNKLFIS